MIRAVLGGGARPVVLLGIDGENVARLKDGKPIKVAGSELGLSADIAIAYGERLQDIVDELAHAGIDVPTEVLEQAQTVDRELRRE